MTKLITEVHLHIADVDAKFITKRGTVGRKFHNAFNDALHATFDGINTNELDDYNYLVEFSSPVEFEKIEQFGIDNSFSVEIWSVVEAKAPAAEVIKNHQTMEFLTDHERQTAEIAAKAKEIKSRKPVHIPASPAHEPVAEKTALPPIPSLPAFLQIASPAIPPVPKAITPALVSAAADAIEEFGEDELERFAEEQRQAADRAANAAIANTDPLRPRVSTIKFATKKVWDIADRMFAEAAKNNSPAPKRKEVIEECVRNGIAYGTARTQFQHWFKCVNDQKTAPIATIGADGKVRLPS